MGHLLELRPPATRRRVSLFASALTSALVLTLALAVAPASATVILSSSNPGIWSQDDTASQPSHRCIYGPPDSDSYMHLLKIRVWPPHVQSRVGGTKLRWHFMIRRQKSYVGAQSTVYTSPWQTQIKPIGSWATSFTPQTWSPPGAYVFYYVWVEIQWRDAVTNTLTGSVRYRLEWHREMWSNAWGAFIAAGECWSGAVDM